MCTIDREEPATLAEFLQKPFKPGPIAARISESLPCGCRPSHAARRSGRRGLTIKGDGTVLHTRCGQVIGQISIAVKPAPKPKMDWGDVLRRSLPIGDHNDLALLVERHGPFDD